MKRTLHFATKLNPTVQQPFLNQSLDPPPPRIKNTGSAPDIRPVILETLKQEHAALFKIIISTRSRLLFLLPT